MQLDFEKYYRYKVRGDAICALEMQTSLDLGDLCDEVARLSPNARVGSLLCWRVRAMALWSGATNLLVACAQIFKRAAYCFHLWGLLLSSKQRAHRSALPTVMGWNVRELVLLPLREVLHIAGVTRSILWNPPRGLVQWKRNYVKELQERRAFLVGPGHADDAHATWLRESSAVRFKASKVPKEQSART